MNLRQTHTVAELGLSQPAYDEIAAKLRAAGYDHVFGEAGLIDMSGIGVSLDPGAEARGTITIDSQRASQRIAQLEEEVRADDLLLRDRDSLLAAIPQCRAHGPCVPHALAWIEEVRGQGFGPLVDEHDPSTAIKVDERESAINRCIRALAFSSRTLLECELSLKAHPDSSVAQCRTEGERALAGVGVTWCPQRGWMQDVRPAGAVPLRTIEHTTGRKLIFQRRQGYRKEDRTWVWGDWRVCTEQEAMRVDGLRSWQWRKLDNPLEASTP